MNVCDNGGYYNTHRCRTDCVNGTTYCAVISSVANAHLQDEIFTLSIWNRTGFFRSKLPI